ncbi:unnamed protein product, partial [Mesorhabditis spiculigera]
MADIVGPLRPSDSWSTTEVKSIQHSHVWNIRGFSQCECRYLETAVKVREQTLQLPTSGLGVSDHGTMAFRIRLHPQGNKESNKDFTFFQVFCSANTARYKAKFTVFNTRNEEIPTTIYTGTQQLHGYFEYIRRDLLVSHIAPHDELQLVLTLTVTFDTVTKSSQNSAPRPPFPEARPAEVTRDLEAIFRDPRLSDFKIMVGSRELLVHKVIVAARSPYFAALLEPHTEESRTGVLRLHEEDVDYEVMSELVAYMYTGRCHRLTDMALELLAAADRFAMPGLKEVAEQNLRATLSIDGCCRSLMCADIYGAADLKADAVRFITQNSSTVIQTDGWQHMVSSKPELVTEVVQAISDITSSTPHQSSSSSVEPPSKRLRVLGPADLRRP